MNKWKLCFSAFNYSIIYCDRMIYNNFQMVCSLPLPKYRVEAIASRAKFRHGSLSFSGSEKHLPLNSFFYLFCGDCYTDFVRRRKMPVHQCSYAAVCSLYFLTTAFFQSSIHLVSCAPRSLLRGWLVLPAFPLLVAIHGSLPCAKSLQRGISQQLGSAPQQGPWLCLLGALLCPQKCADNLPAVRQGRNTKQVLQAPALNWVGNLAAGKRMYCPFFCWTTCAARAATGSSDCQSLFCFPLNLTSGTTQVALEKAAPFTGVGFLSACIVVVLLTP